MNNNYKFLTEDNLSDFLNIVSSIGYNFHHLKNKFIKHKDSSRNNDNKSLSINLSFDIDDLMIKISKLVNDLKIDDDTKERQLKEYINEINQKFAEYKKVASKEEIDVFDKEIKKYIDKIKNHWIDLIKFKQDDNQKTVKADIKPSKSNSDSTQLTHSNKDENEHSSTIVKLVQDITTILNGKENKDWGNKLGMILFDVLKLKKEINFEKPGFIKSFKQFIKKNSK